MQKSKLPMLKNLRGLSSLLHNSSTFWKDSFEKNLCTCGRDEEAAIEPKADDSSENASEVKKSTDTNIIIILIYYLLILCLVLFNVAREDEPKEQVVEYQKEWTQEETQLLIDNYFTKQIKNWKKLSEIIKTKSAQQCNYKIKKIEKEKTKTFTIEDDLKLTESVNLHGKNWELIAKSFTGFSPTMLEERYSSKLDPGLKRTKFTIEEDDKIVSLYEQFGNNWKKIATFFKDRNSNMIKNRFYSVLKKKVPSLMKIKTLSSDSNSNMNFYQPHSIEANEVEEFISEPFQLTSFNTDVVRNYTMNTDPKNNDTIINNKYRYFNNNNDAFNSNTYNLDLNGNSGDNKSNNNSNIGYPQIKNNSNNDNNYTNTHHNENNDITITDLTTEGRLENKLSDIIMSNLNSNKTSEKNKDDENNLNSSLDKFMEVGTKVFYNDIFKDHEVEIYYKYDNNDRYNNSSLKKDQN